MRNIPLTQGKVAVIDEQDYELVSAHKWSVKKNHKVVYACARIGSETVLMHRLIFGNPDFQIDHIDGDGLNNTRANLRAATSSQNAQNRRKRSDGHHSNYKGVCRCSGGRWRAEIRVSKVKKHLGVFSLEDDAARAYDLAAKKYFGEFARLNFPGEQTL